MNKWELSDANPAPTAIADLPFQGLVYLCYAICIICIVAGTALSLLAIWGGIIGPMLFKFYATIATFFCGSMLTLVVTRVTVKRN